MPSAKRRNWCPWSRWFSPEQLKEELDWIDAHIGDYPYGVDTVIPQKYEGMDNKDPEELLEQLKALVPMNISNLLKTYYKKQEFLKQMYQMVQMVDCLGGQKLQLDHK